MIKNKYQRLLIITAILLALSVAWFLKTICVYAKPVQVEKSKIAPVQLETPEEIAEEDYWNSLELLAVCVEAEAGNQGLEGKRLVVDVILNRVDDKSDEWPDSITEVIMQDNHFTSYWDGGMESVIEPSEETFKAVRMELEERSYPGIYYFREGKWSDYGTPWKKVGDHYFSTK